MATTSRQHSARSEQVASFSATAAKNAFGAVMDRALTDGMALITRRGKPRAVVLSMEAFEALSPAVEDPLVTLREEFDELVAHMQRPEAAKAGEALFSASGPELGEAARAASAHRR